MVPVIPYSDYIWGDRFRDAVQGWTGVSYANIDNVGKLPRTATRIVTHNGDNPVTQQHLRRFRGLYRWAGTNVCVSHHNVHPIPIGLENDYIGGQPGRKHLLAEAAASELKPTQLCYWNCSATHADRAVAEQHFQQQAWCTKRTRSPYVQFLSEMLDHSFVVCPRGNGLDTHRTWETLYLRRYPILKREASLEQLYADLPVVFVDAWSDVTIELLQRQRQTLAAADFNWDKLRFDYWREKLKGLFGC